MVHMNAYSLRCACHQDQIMGNPLWSVEKIPLQISITWNISQRGRLLRQEYTLACEEMNPQF